MSVGAGRRRPGISPLCEAVHAATVGTDRHRDGFGDCPDRIADDERHRFPAPARDLRAASERAAAPAARVTLVLVARRRLGNLLHRRVARVALALRPGIAAGRHDRGPALYVL